MRARSWLQLGVVRRSDVEELRLHCPGLKHRLQLIHVKPLVSCLPNRNQVQVGVAQHVVCKKYVGSFTSIVSPGCAKDVAHRSCAWELPIVKMKCSCVLRVKPATARRNPLVPMFAEYCSKSLTSYTSAESMTAGYAWPAYHSQSCCRGQEERGLRLGRVSRAGADLCAAASP